MKKNISINISGIIFHVEEDGYEKLKNYLDSVNNYFSTYEDSKEIIEDIEGRIAEIFLMKLNDNKQVINIEDIESLISTMGTTADFEATIDPDEDLPKDNIGNEDKNEKSHYSESKEERKLFKDLKKKLIGGVAAGIARYFSVDPLWIRILFLSLLIFPLISWPAGSVSFISFFVYVILWIVLPGKEFEEDQKVKKLYRDPDEKILGGISSGLANYFGIDRVAVRVLFVIGIPLGLIGPVLYIILWIITPEAFSITEKLEMQGEPVTLSSIESNIKKELNEDEEGEEKLYITILLLPFRFIAIIIKAISQVLTPFMKFILEAVRVIFGVGISITGISIIFSIIFFVLAYYGGLGDINLNVFDDVKAPASYLKGVINNSTLIFGAIAGIIPAFLLIMLGVALIVKRYIINSYIGWSLGGLWLIGAIGFAISLPNNYLKFSERDVVKETRRYDLIGKAPLLELNDLYDDFENVRLSLRGHEEEDFKLSINYEAKGHSRKNARERAEQITYQVEQKDSIFYFDSNISVPNRDIYEFSFQNVTAIFYIPFNQPFKISRELSEILYNTLHLSGYRVYQLENNEWIFNSEGKLACLTCDSNPSSSKSFRPYKRENSSGNDDFSIDDYRGAKKEFEVGEFDEIEANGIFDIEVIQGDTYSLIAKGSDRIMRRVEISTSGDILTLDYDGKLNWFKNRNDDKIGVIITVPELTAIDLTGAAELYLRPFDANNLTIDLNGASFLDGEIKASELHISLSGASKAVISGTTEELELELGGASSIKANKLSAFNLKVDAGGASKASVFGENELDLEASGASKIYYSGPGEIRRRSRSGAGRILKD